MLNKEFLSGRMKKSLKAARRMLVHGFNEEGADYSFNPLVELYNINGKTVLVGDETGDKQFEFLNHGTVLVKRPD